jgi:uncharacterized protein (TIGR00369 family)
MASERRFGVAPPADIEGLSGLEMLQAMVEGRLPAPPMAGTLGFLLVEVSPGVAVFEGSPGPHLLNPLGSVHGGWALTLIDSATGCALHTELPAGTGYTTVETRANFTRAIPPDAGPLRCEGRLLTRGRQIATAEAKLLFPDGRIAAHGSSTLIILPPR